MLCFLLCFLFKLFVSRNGVEWSGGTVSDSCGLILKEGEEGRLGSKWPVSVPRRVEQRDVIFVCVCISGTDAIIYVFMTLQYSFS